MLDKYWLITILFIVVLLLIIYIVLIGISAVFIKEDEQNVDLGTSFNLMVAGAIIGFIVLLLIGVVLIIISIGSYPVRQRDILATEEISSLSILVSIVLIFISNLLVMFALVTKEFTSANLSDDLKVTLWTGIAGIIVFIAIFVLLGLVYVTMIRNIYPITVK